MKFTLNYSEIKRLNQFEYKIEDENEKDFLEDIYIVQKALSETGKVEIFLFCLGENWNMFIWDLPLFAEHLLKIFDTCDTENGKQYSMWFYKEGMDRKLLFTKVNSQIIRIENVSGDKWISPLQFEDIKIDDLKNQIHNFVNKIKEAVEIIYPELNQLEMLQQWYKSFEV